MSLFVLFETSLGYALFEVNGYEEIQQNSDEFVNSGQTFKSINKAIHQFKTSQEALDNIRGVMDREVTDQLTEFLKMQLPIKKKSSSKSFSLAVSDPKFGKVIADNLGVQIQHGEFINEIFRAIRLHIHKYLKVAEEDLIRSQLGLGHSYSRMKCMFDVNRQDKPVVQSIALIDQLDKNINSFCMRIKEWFGWHFPELSRILSDNSIYVKVVQLIETRNNLVDNSEDLLSQIEEIVIEADLAKQIIDAAAASMGSDISDIDLLNVKFFCDKVNNLIKYREDLLKYLNDKMHKLAPNVSALVGETVAARLISHAGSLGSLAKYPASTIQILGAEKALFRALKTRGKTPKYGLLYHSSYIGKAHLKNKGKISRYLANKLAMCSRIDYFSEDRNDDYGLELKNQVEERLKFLADGKVPRKNVDVMKEVYQKISKRGKKAKGAENGETNGTHLKKKKKRSNTADEDDEEVNIKESEVVVEKKKKKKKVEVADESD